MKIRYHQIGTGVWNTTKEFDPNGTPLNKYRLAINTGEWLTGNRLLAELMKPLYPDVPFSVRLPLVRLPKFHLEWRWIEEMQPEGYIVKRHVYTKVWDVTEDEYDLNLSLYEDVLRIYLTVVQEHYLPNIPDSPVFEWQLVNDSNPYKERFTPILVEPGRFRGNFFMPAEVDLFEYFTIKSATNSNPLLALTKVIK
jgi:hypothetical protein